MLVILLLGSFSEVLAQNNDSVFYRNEYRYLFAQPGLSYVHNFNQDFGVELSCGFSFVGLNRTYPFAQNTNLPLAQIETGQGFTVDASGRVCASEHLIFSVGVGYRYFDASSNWVTTSSPVGGKNYTEYQLSELSKGFLLFGVFDFHNATLSRAGIELGIRAGINTGSCQTDVTAGREWQNGYSRPIDLSTNTAPFLPNTFNNAFYCSIRLAAGIRCSKKYIPADRRSLKSGSWISRHLDH